MSSARIIALVGAGIALFFLAVIITSYCVKKKKK